MKISNIALGGNVKCQANSPDVVIEERPAPKVNLPLCERGREGDFNTIKQGHPERLVCYPESWPELVSRFVSGSLYSNAFALMYNVKI